MKVINDSRPFNVGDEIARLDGPPDTVVSWNPSRYDVTVMNHRGQMSRLAWQSALYNKVARDGA